MAKFKVAIGHLDVETFATKHDADLYAQKASKDGDVIGIEGGGRSKFYLRRGRTLYPISVEAAGVELAMRGSDAA